MVPSGANAISPLADDGRVAYTSNVGLSLPGLRIRHSDALSEPAPVQSSSVNRSPLSGSTATWSGQVTFGATVRTTWPVMGSSSSTAPVKKLPVVAARVAYSLPSKPNAGLLSVGPTVASRFALDTAPPTEPN